MFGIPGSLDSGFRLSGLRLASLRSLRLCSFTCGRTAGSWAPRDTGDSLRVLHARPRTRFEILFFWWIVKRLDFFLIAVGGGPNNVNSG